MKRAIYNCTRYLAPRHIIVGMIVHVIAYPQLVPDLKFNVSGAPNRGGGWGGLNPPWILDGGGLNACQPPLILRKIFLGGVGSPLNWSNYIVYVFLST